MAIFGTDGDCQRVNTNCPSFGDRSCARTGDGINGTSDVYALPIGQSFGSGSTKFVPTVASALIASFELCERARSPGMLPRKVCVFSQISDVGGRKSESLRSIEDVSEIIFAYATILD